MPTYEYECAGCGHQFDAFQSITARALKKCPECGKNELQRLIGSGAGIIFKGSGFYQTDYRSEEYNKAAKAEKDAAPGSDKKPDGKPDDKKGAEKKIAEKTDSAKTGKATAGAKKTSSA